MSDHARRILALHARTTKYFGVDFLPIGEGVAGGDAPVSADPGGDAIPMSAAVREKAPAMVEPKVAPAPKKEVARVDRDELIACYQGETDPGAKLAKLRAKYEADAPHEAFVTGFTNIVFGEGDPGADLMFIGEAPGESEDLSGRPFVGRAGQLLEKMIIAMGLSRETVYITNVLKTRPPNNATPTQDEAMACAPYLIEQIRIVDPKVIVTLGAPASHTLLETSAPMRDLRGRFHTFPGEGEGVGGFGVSLMRSSGLSARVVMPTYHPAYLLRSYTEENRRKVWSDLQLVMGRLGLSRG